MASPGRSNPFGDSSKNFVFFPSLSHKKTVHRMVRGLESDCGLILLTGEIGIGKTSLARHIQGFLADRFVFVELGNPYLTPLEQVALCCEKFGLSTDGLSSIHDCVAALERFFHAVIEQGKRPVIVFDESHLLTKRHLSLIHILSNLRHQEEPLVQIVLVGQLEILGLLATEGMEALNQRIGVRCELAPLTLADTEKYIRFKLDKAGKGGVAVFPPETVRRIWEESRGLPRLINHVCAHALDALAFKEDKVVTPGMVDAVCSDSVYTGMFRPVPEAATAPSGGMWRSVALVAACVVLLAVAWQLWRPVAAPSLPAPVAEVRRAVAPPALSAPQPEHAEPAAPSDPFVPEEVVVVDEDGQQGEPEETPLDGNTHPVIGRLVIGALAWSENPASRMVVIDSRLLHEGEQVDGARIIHIENDWIVFEYQGMRYRRTFLP